MRDIIPSRRFERDLKRMLRRGKEQSKLVALVARLQAGEPLDPRHRPHALLGAWQPYRECHIEPDWLLIYEVTDDAVYLLRTGTHADLF